MVVSVGAVFFEKCHIDAKDLHLVCLNGPPSKGREMGIPIRDSASRHFLLPQARSVLTLQNRIRWVPGSTPSSHLNTSRLEFSLPPEESMCALGMQSPCRMERPGHPLFWPYKDKNYSENGPIKMCPLTFQKVDYIPVCTTSVLTPGKYSANPPPPILSLQVVPYPQAILKFHPPGSLDYRSCHRLLVGFVRSALKVI